MSCCSLHKQTSAFLLAIVLSGCAGRSTPQSGGGGRNSPQAVNVVSVELRKLDSTMTLPAQITPYEIVDVYPKVTGFVEEIRVDRGSRVHAGELMIRLSAPELAAQRSQAEANRQTAQSQLTSSEAKLASDRGTYEHLSTAAKTPGVVAGNDLLVAEQTVAADRAQVEAAANNVHAADDALRSVSQLESYLAIRAPFDGVVTSRNLHPGALVGPASGASGALPIVQIEKLDRLRLTVPVPEAYIGGVREGQEVAFVVPAYPGHTFHAPIARISHEVDQRTRTMAVEVEVHNGDLQITPGSFATVTWPVQRTYNTLFVPQTAVATDLQRTFVIRVHEGKAEWVDVKTGVAVNTETEVFGELKSGDLVVRNATDAIRSGAAVEARQSSPSGT